MELYEQERILNVYLLFHYGSREDILAGAGIGEFPDEFFRFPVATARDTFDLSAAPFARALDLGCAVGRSAFELSKHASEVVAIDFSAAFIAAAERLRRGESVPFLRYREAHLADRVAAEAPADGKADRIRFEAGDAMNLRDDLGAFDLVHAANLLCRLTEPFRLLSRLPNLVKPGGQLVMATPCTWLEEFTPPKDQPKGETRDFLFEALGDTFELQKTVELPFLIREHQRKFQISTSQTTVWQRKG